MTSEKKAQNTPAKMPRNKSILGLIALIICAPFLYILYKIDRWI